jgi:hypothetical protein
MMPHVGGGGVVRFAQPPGHSQDFADGRYG